MTDQVFLLSEKSSGSSIFQRELARHSHINTVEWTPHSEAETLYWLKAANILGYPREAFWASQPPFPARYSRRSLERILLENTGSLPPHDDDWRFLATGWEQLTDRFGPVFFEKSPHHLNQWPALACINRFVRETSKTVKFIGLVRNPLSVIYSAHQRWHTQVYARQFMWEQSYRNLLAVQQLYSPEQVLIVRYEDLIDSPRKHFEEILAFIGLEYEEPIGRDLHSGSLNKWESDDSFSFRVHPNVMQTGMRFGYTEKEMTCLKPAVKAGRSAFSGTLSRVFARVRSRINFYRQHVLK